MSLTTQAIKKTLPSKQTLSRTISLIRTMEVRVFSRTPIHHVAKLSCFILSFVAVIALLGCSTVNDKTTENIIGNWQWVASRGGWTGTMAGPFSTGNTRRVVFDADGKVTFYTNGEVTLSSTYSLGEAWTIGSEHLPIVYVGDHRKYMYSFYDAKWLELREDANDGYVHWYAREEIGGK